MTPAEVDAMPEAERETRIRITFGQLEAFERAHHELLHAPVPEDVDPLIRQAEIDAAAAVAGDLRTELELLAGGRYACTERHPWDRTIQRRAIHPAAEDAGTCSAGCCDRWRCPRCDTSWTASPEGC